MIRNFVRLRNKLIRMKVYVSRTTSYISLINAGMILFLFLSNLENYGIDIRIEQWIVPIFILGIVMMVLFGYMEDRLGFYKQEQRTTQARNPYMNNIIERLDRIEEKLEKKD